MYSGQLDQFSDLVGRRTCPDRSVVRLAAAAGVAVPLVPQAASAAATRDRRRRCAPTRRRKLRSRRARPAIGSCDGQPCWCWFLRVGCGGLDRWRWPVAGGRRRSCGASPCGPRPVRSYITCLTCVYSSKRVRAHVLAEADGLVAAVRHLADDRDVVVDPDAAGPDLAGGPQRAEDVAGPGRGRQAVRRVVGQRDALVVGVERQHDQHRAEHLVLDDLGRPGRRRRPASARSRRPRASAPPGHRAAADDLGAVAARPLDEAGDALLLPARDQRALVGGRVERVARAARWPSASATPGDERVVERALHVGAGGRGAVLPGVDQRRRRPRRARRPRGRRRRTRRTAPCRRARGAPAWRSPAAAAMTRLPDGGRAGERHHDDVGVADQGLAGHRPACR